LQFEKRRLNNMPGFTLGKYLATRFEQIGLKHYFMVPGDYNLVLLDELLSNKNVEQIGCCNELNGCIRGRGLCTGQGVRRCGHHVQRGSVSGALDDFSRPILSPFGGCTRALRSFEQD
jgi:hypothetical protein